MKRLVFATLVLLMAASASAFDAEKRGGRIALLQVYSPERPGEGPVGTWMVSQLRNKLRKSGFEAFTVGATLEQVQKDPLEDVDYYVELAPWDADSNPYGAVGVHGPHHGGDIALVRSTLFAQLRVIDARTFEVIGMHRLSERSTALMPIGLGFGSRDWHGWIALPLGQWLQYRRMTRRIVEDAAVRVAEIVRTTA